MSTDVHGWDRKETRWGERPREPQLKRDLTTDEHRLRAGGANTNSEQEGTDRKLSVRKMGAERCGTRRPKTTDNHELRTGGANTNSEDLPVGQRRRRGKQSGKKMGAER
jgi:hypothetical protein